MCVDVDLCPGLKGYVGVHGVLCPGLKGYVGVNEILGHFLFGRSFLDPILELMSTHSKKA